MRGMRISRGMRAVVMGVLALSFTLAWLSVSVPVSRAEWYEYIECRRSTCDRCWTCNQIGVPLACRQCHDYCCLVRCSSYECYDVSCWFEYWCDCDDWCLFW
jgi:hypothetical protein